MDQRTTQTPHGEVWVAKACGRYILLSSIGFLDPSVDFGEDAGDRVRVEYGPDFFALLHDYKAET